MAVAQQMTTIQYVAMLSALGITGKKEKELARYLRHYLGKGFCPSQQNVAILAEGHAEVFTDRCKWRYPGKDKDEIVEWTEKDIHKELEIQLTRELKGRNVRPSQVKKVHAVIGGDHGNTAFQFSAAIKAILESGEEVYCEILACELICRTDSSELLERTILPRLSKGLEIMAMTNLHIYSTDENSLLCSFTPPPIQIDEQHTILEVQIFVTGDLSFQAMTLGREDMSGKHCMMCKTSGTQMNKDRHTIGDCWTFPELESIGKDSVEKKKALHGVKNVPWWSFLKFEHHMVPLLHCLIGVGNNLLDRFCDVVNEFIEIKSNEEIKIERELTNLTQTNPRSGEI